MQTKSQSVFAQTKTACQRRFNQRLQIPFFIVSRFNSSPDLLGLSRNPTVTKTGTVKTTNNRTDTEAVKMEIIITNKELTKQEIYFLTKAQDVMKMKDAVDSVVELSAWVIYTDVNADGEEVELFSMRTVDGETYATNSSTFIKAFRDILDVFTPEEVTKLKIMSGTSKNNRQFVTCAYAE